MLNIIKKLLILPALCFLIVSVLFSYLEAESIFAATAADSAVVTLGVITEVSITSPADTSMSTNIGVTSNSAIATTTWNVKTNNSAGYSLTLAASTNPAMQSGGNRIEDYSTTTATSLWSVASGQAKFGFSVYGTDVSTATWGTAGTQCGATSTPSTTLKYSGFYTTATTTATRSSTTTFAGIDTTVCYAVQQNNYYIPSGTYTATITATATTL